MRKRLGGMLLAAGVVGLGLWGNFNQAQVMETAIADRAAEVVASSVHGIQAVVEGRDIKVTGVVNDASEKDTVLAALDEIEGRRVVVDELTIIPKVSPFTYEKVTTADETTITGFVPSEAARAELAPSLGEAANGLTLSSGAPVGWTAAVLAGNEALAQLKSGTLSISDQTVTLSGLAATPVEKEAALAVALPDGFVLNDEIELEDDGKPFSLKAEFTGNTTNITGKLPVGADIAAMTSGRGLKSVTSEVAVARIGDPDEIWPDFAQTGLAALGRLENGSLEMEGRKLVLSGVGSPSGKADAESMLGALPLALDVTTDITIFDDGRPIMLTATKQEGTGIVATTGKLPLDYDVTAARIAESVSLRYSYLTDETGHFDANLLAAAGALLKLREGTLVARVDGVNVSGVADTAAIKQSAETRLAELVKGEVETNITIYDDGAPFALMATKAEDGTLSATGGKLPLGITEQSYQLAPNADLVKAEIADDAGTFDPNVKAGLAALQSLNSGTMDVTADRIKITGTANTPAEESAVMAALAGLPGNVESEVVVTVLDDGTPPAYTVMFDATKGIEVDGKLPAGLTADDIAASMGVPMVNATATTGLTGDAAKSEAALEAFSSWLPELERGTLQVNGDAIDVSGVVSPGNDLSLVNAGMQSGLGAGASIALEELAVLPTTGTRRTNVVTQEDESFMRVAWLQISRFEPTASTCEEQTANILANNKINFVTGSDQLDAKSARAINALASLVRRCIMDARLKAEVQGHTDSQGSDANNEALSQARAARVAEALIARGIPSWGISARGYGESQPIADNATAEGRAQNRRTTIQWSK